MYVESDLYTDVWVSAFKSKPNGGFFYSFERLQLSQYFQSETQIFFKKTLKHNINDYDGCSFIVYTQRLNNLPRLKVVFNEHSKFIRTPTSQLCVLRRPDLQKYQLVLILDE